MAKLKTSIVGNGVEIGTERFGVTIVADASPATVDAAALLLLESAAGFSRFDVVKSFLEATGALANG
jgi:hypothetical protein